MRIYMLFLCDYGRSCSMYAVLVLLSCCYYCYCCCVDIRGAAAACLRLVLEPARARPIANLKRAVWFLMVSVVLRADGGWDIKDGANRESLCSSQERCYSRVVAG